MRSRGAIRLALGALALAVAAVVWRIPGALHLVFMFGPVLLVVAPLVCGRYPGERHIARLAAVWQARRAKRAPAPRPSVRPVPPRLVPRGGRLIACSLAVRPPPVFLGAR